MKEQNANFELLEPVSPEDLVPDSRLDPWLPVALAVALLLLLAAWIAVRKRSADADPHAARNAARREAAAALENVDATDGRSAAIRSSLILRKYLSVAAGDPALFQTHEEFVSRHDALKALSDEARAASETGFARLAALKYPPEIPAADPAEIVAESKVLLETLHHGFRA